MKSFFVFLLTAIAVSAAQRPNIIFFLSDDHRWDRLGCAGHPFLKTPNIDKLATEGVLLTNYFTNWLCGPSRASFLTGRYPVRTGFWSAPNETNLPANESTIAQEMKDAGYRTALVRVPVAADRWSDPTVRCTLCLR